MTKSQSHCFIIELTSLHTTKCWFSWPKIIQKFKRPSNFRASVDREDFFLNGSWNFHFFADTIHVGPTMQILAQRKHFWGLPQTTKCPAEKSDNANGEHFLPRRARGLQHCYIMWSVWTTYCVGVVGVDSESDDRVNLIYKIVRCRWFYFILIGK